MSAIRLENCWRGSQGLMVIILHKHLPFLFVFTTARFKTLEILLLLQRFAKQQEILHHHLEILQFICLPTLTLCSTCTGDVARPPLSNPNTSTVVYILYICVMTNE